MNQLNLIAVPNGIFSLEEIIETPPMKEFIQQLKSIEDAETTKVKVFLTAYQIADTLAQLSRHGFNSEQVNMEKIKESMKMTIELGYDSIMKTFTNNERKRLHELVRKAPEH